MVSQLSQHSAHFLILQDVMQIPTKGVKIKLPLSRNPVQYRSCYYPKIIPKEVYLAISEEGGTVPDRIHSATICVTDIADFGEFVRRYSSNDVRSHLENYKPKNVLSFSDVFFLDINII